LKVIHNCPHYIRFFAPQLSGGAENKIKNRKEKRIFMKKVFALVLALALVMCGFTACSGKNGGSDTKTDADLTKVGEYTANNTEYVIGATGPLTGDAS